MERECNHPNHLKYLEDDKKNPTVYLKEDGTKKIIEPLTNDFVKSPKYGMICLNCVCHEVGDFIEEHPIHDNI
jgi:hypothetical protein